MMNDCQLSPPTFCGYVALLGRPNVGKSTLMNRLIQKKVSITSRKPQTTRHRILGITTAQNIQMIYVDLPGVHPHKGGMMNHYMNKVAMAAIYDVDVIVFVVEGLVWTALDEFVLQKIASQKIPVLLAVNKVDKIKDKSVFLPHLQQLSTYHDFSEIIPISAKTGVNIESLTQSLIKRIPPGPFLFDTTQTTDRSMQFMASEFIREQVFRLCGQELPYSVTVQIEKFQEEEQLYRIAGLIIVNKDNHKGMIIGKKGEKLKEIGTQARLTLERALQKKVFLQLWVKVKSKWSEDETILRSLGYD